jgi:hypothetical protein
MLVILLILFRQVSVCLGNQRPDALARAERVLWKSVVEVATGSSGFKELSNFFEQFQQIHKNFVKGEKDLAQGGFQHLA